VSEELQLIKQHLTGLSPDHENYHEILQKLIPIINHLLDRDMQLLMQVLYRVDVDEEKFKKALAFSDPKELGEKVSLLIIERQLQKIETRKNYEAGD